MSEAIKNRIWIFRGVLFIQILFLVFAVYYVYVKGRLPQPFQNVLLDTFMDFFNTNWWAYNSNRYLEWRSTYPPFTFVLAKIFVPKKCLGGDAAALRDCSTYVLYFFIPIYACAAYLSLKLINRYEDFRLKRDQWVIAIAILISMPFLYTLERMNYLIVAYIFYCLYLMRNQGFLKYLFFGLAVNIKPYLLILAFSYIIRREIKKFIYCIALTIVIFLLGTLLLKDGSAILFISNMFNFGKNFPIPVHALNFQSSFLPILSYMTLDDYFIEFIDVLKYLIYLIPIFLLVSVRNQMQKLEIIEIDFLLLIVMLFSTSSLGGYSLIFLIPFFSLFNKNDFSIFLLIACLLIPFDFVLYQGPLTRAEISYLSGAFIQNGLTITTGAILRPAFIGAIFILYILHIKRNKDTSAISRCLARHNKTL